MGQLDRYYIMEGDERRYVAPEEIVIKEMPFSEVMMHMHMAGQVFPAMLEPSLDPRHTPSARVFTLNGYTNVTPGEAGFFTEYHAVVDDYGNIVRGMGRV